MPRISHPGTIYISGRQRMTVSLHLFSINLAPCVCIVRTLLKRQ
ncbi:hypothetical protein CSB69_2201 [Morganella morganii]|nr:hypothetical protein CSB69_2201 [Morganella morganii]